MPSKNHYQGNRKRYLQLENDYYKNNKDHVLKHLKNKYNNLSKEEKY